MGTIITINLDTAGPEQSALFDEPHLTQTLASIRDAVGDARALIHVRRQGRTTSYVFQTLEDFNTGGAVPSLMPTASATA